MAEAPLKRRTKRKTAGGRGGGPRRPKPGLLLERREVGALTFDPANARQHPERNLDAIRASLQRFGQQKPIVVTPEGMVLAGNGTLQAARDLGWTHIDCIVTALEGIDRTAFAIADNRTAELASWDDSTLATLLEELHHEGMELDAVGFSDAELEAMLETEQEAEPQLADIEEDEVPEPPAQAMTRPGDLWILGDHRLLCGDSRKAEDVERLMAGAQINLAFTSPPYASQREYDESSGFKPIPPDEFVEWFEPVAGNVRHHLASDGSWFVNIKEAVEKNQRLDYVKRLVLQHKDSWGWLWIEEYCWPRIGVPIDPKKAKRFKNAWESVFHFATQTDFVFRPDEVRHESDKCFNYEDQKAAGKDLYAQGVGGGVTTPVNQFTGLAYPSNRLPVFGQAKALGHPAAFPVGLPAFFIQAFSEDVANVYDPFLGSGTTLIAAEQLGRRCYGVEISPAYCDAIVRRWEEFTGRKAEREKAQSTAET